MSANSSIEWTDTTWNPVRGCDPVSPGCANCYAAGHAARFSGPGLPYEGLATRKKGQPAKWTGVIALVDDKLAEPLSWKKPQRVFVNSMSDLFHEDVPDQFICKVFRVMGEAKQHTFQVLTKRPERMQRFMREQTNAHAIRSLEERDFYVEWPYPNVWLGVSVENRQHGLPRIDYLRNTPAAVRFLSVEPLLEDLGEIDLTGIHWVIVGGESGHKSRLCRVEWVRSVVEQCRAANVAAFVKQLGSLPTGEWGGGGKLPGLHMLHPSQPWSLHDSKGGDIKEFPADLRIREFPSPSGAPA